MLPLTLCFICRHDIVLVVAKKWLVSERFFLFLERGVHSKNKQQLMPHFFLNKFFDRIFFDNYF